MTIVKSIAPPREKKSARRLVLIYAVYGCQNKPLFYRVHAHRHEQYSVAASYGTRVIERDGEKEFDETDGPLTAAAESGKPKKYRAS